MFRTWLIKRLGLTADDFVFVQHFDSKDSKFKHRILTEAVKKLFNTIGPDDILGVNEDGSWRFEGRDLLQVEVKELQEAGKQFSKSKLWKVLETELKYQANKKMFMESQSDMDLVAGKLLLFLTDVIKTRLKRM